MRFKRRKPSGARIEMIPLIDIIFLLLVVFIYAMLSMTVHKGIRIELPEAVTADRDEDRDPFTVTIGPGGKVYVDLDSVSLGELTDLVAAEAGRRGDAHIQINAHENITHGRLVQVLDSIRAGGVTSLSIMTEDYKAQN
ncbi:MAG: ExbD/TolR family protein [Planctomycetota bacterium]|jgi:biopolymer transport protein ExbD